MRNRIALVILPALAVGTACAKTPPNTIPVLVSPTADVQYYDLEVPRDLEIKAVDFDATTYADVGGPAGGPTTSTVAGRAFVKVYAVHSATGEHFLLLYEDIARRKRPVQIIRFVPGTDRATRDSVR